MGWADRKKLVDWCDATIDWKWDPSNCVSCQYNCKECPYLNGQDIDIKFLQHYCDLGEFWEHFNNIVVVSELDSNGLLTVSQAQAYLQQVDVEMFPIHFWKASGYALSRWNESILKKRKIDQHRKGK